MEKIKYFCSSIFAYTGKCYQNADGNVNRNFCLTEFKAIATMNITERQHTRVIFPAGDSCKRACLPFGHWF